MPFMVREEIETADEHAARWSNPAVQLTMVQSSCDGAQEEW